MYAPRETERIAPTHSWLWHWMGPASRLRRALPSGKDPPPVPIGWEAGWFSELVWMQNLEEKSFSSAGYRTLVVHSIVRHCWLRYASSTAYIVYVQINCVRELRKNTGYRLNSNTAEWASCPWRAHAHHGRHTWVITSLIHLQFHSLLLSIYRPRTTKPIVFE
jgi:hypothetical protein